MPNSWQTKTAVTLSRYIVYYWMQLTMQRSNARCNCNALSRYTTGCS